MRKAIPSAALAAAALLLASCFDFLAGGSGTGTGNSVEPAVAAALVHVDGAPAAGVSIRVREARYVRDPALGAAKRSVAADTVTDAKGRFRIDSLPPGDYVLEASDGKDGVLWRFRIPSQGAPAFSVRSDTVAALGSLRGRVALRGEASSPLYVGVRGLERLAPVNADDGAYTIAGLPAGAYALAVRLGGNDSLAPDVEAVVARGQGNRADTLVIASPYPEWKHRATLTLNTTASGAGVPANVAHFPLLVRLDGAQFPFAQAAPDGADLRFAKADGTRLPFEIERWDPAQGKAEIWVALDTVYGNRQDQAFSMLWGNPAALPRSSGGAVFPAADGYRGVWHFSESAAGVGSEAAFKDATGQGNDGLDSVSSDGKAGIIGLGQTFGGAGDYIRVRKHVLDLSSRSFTLSAWVLPRSRPGSLLGQYGPDGKWSEGEADLYFGDGTWIQAPNTGGQCSDGRIAPGRCVNGLFPSFVGFGRNYLVSSAALDTASWHLVTMVWNADAAPGGGTFYLDGKPVASGNNSLSAGPDSAAFDFYIGKPGGLESAEYFQGSLDELNVLQTAEDPMRIRLRYESQRTDGRLLRVSGFK